MIRTKMVLLKELVVITRNESETQSFDNVSAVLQRDKELSKKNNLGHFLVE
jgi:hypothetical protein